MHIRTRKILEFTKILEKLQQYCIMEENKNRCLTMTMHTELSELEHMQNEIEEALFHISTKGPLPLNSPHAIRSICKRVRLGSILTGLELMQLSHFLYNIKKIRQYFAKTDDTNDLTVFYKDFNELRALREEIDRVVVSEDEISDEASPGLLKIRKESVRLQEKIKRSLQTLMSSKNTREMLQDQLVTLRNGRYCLPIKSEYKSHFKGMVHDQSQSGNTFFIEPISVIEENNRLKELEIKEAQEIEKILIGLSDQVAESSDYILQNYDDCLALDFIFAKAEMSLSMHATRPVFQSEGIVHIKKARHPLLDPTSVVPIDLLIGGDVSILLITGPNTGGKTVSLKTAGLLSMMAQSGLRVPCEEQSTFAIFDQIFADIGDEQSIEQNLSTFSSHLKHIVEILKHCTKNSLLLLDELGSGTDPVEGAALAMAIIDHLLKQKVSAMISTHYSELKLYAMKTPNILNASCEFNVTTLKPTYRLILGIPGKSNAFAIAKRLNLSQDILTKAESFLSKETKAFEDTIKELEYQKKKLEEDQRSLSTILEENIAKQKILQELEENLNQQSKDLRNEANAKAKMVYETAKSEADLIIKNILKEKETSADMRQVEKNRKLLQDKINEHQLFEEISENDGLRQWKEGEEVLIRHLNQTGKIVSLHKNKAVVLSGSIKTHVDVKHLTAIKIKNKTLPKKARPIEAKSISISPQIDLRGFMTDEGIFELDKYLDDAFLSGLKEVTIIHGKGTGAMKKAVNDFLKFHPHVKNQRPGRYGEGEMGVTIAQIR